MHASRTLLFIALLASLAACQQRAPESGASTSPTHTTGAGDGAGDGIGDTVGRAMDQARTKLATENITISRDGTPRAEITPKGDLLIDGKAVPVDDTQRRLLLDYRAQVVGIASAGMDVGTEGAKLASKAVTEAIGGLLSGDPDRIGKRIEAQAEGVKDKARVLCDRLPAMYQAQQRVADAVPEFAPYARMKPDDIADCKRDLDGTPPPPPAPPAAPTPPPSPDA